MAQRLKTLQSEATAAELAPLQQRLNKDMMQVRSAAVTLATSADKARRQALLQAAANIRSSAEQILSANQADLQEARQAQIAAPLLDRLELTAGRIERMAEGLEEIAAMPDMLGKTTELQQQPSGLRIGKMRVPLGVVAIIYESRPNVTADAAALCIRSGNACVLHGGWEARRCNLVIGQAMRDGLRSAGLPDQAVHLLLADQLLRNDNARLLRRQAVQLLVAEPRWVDLVIPRGGRQMAEAICNAAKVPVLKHLDGICHLYIHADANPAMAAELALNSKCYRYAICGAMETLLMDQAVAPQLLPTLAERFAAQGVTLRGCAQSRRLVPDMAEATEQDWASEYLAPVLSVRLVADIDQAIDHIATYGSSHTDGIVTDNARAAARFLRHVDSSSVMHNAATCYADGREYGLGAEVGISTDKFHARGPVGLEGLTSQKFIVVGNGELRS